MSSKKEKRKIRHKRQRVKIFGTKERPRLCLFKSNKHIYAFLINDKEGKTLLFSSDFELKEKNKKIPEEIVRKKKIFPTRKVNLAFFVGKLLAEKAKKAGIKKVVFDRAGWKYHGRVKAVAEGARAGGLEF